jgi:hypothetical protein
MIGGRGFVNCLGRSVAVIVAASLIALVAVQPGLPASASAPAPTIYAATNLSNTSATLNASASPGGVSTALTFCYSTSSITISGGVCTVASGTLSYASAAQSPSSSASAIVVSATVTSLAAGTRYYYAAGASQTAGSTTWSAITTVTTMTGAPFVCTPDFYQANSGYLWRFDAVAQTYVKLNTVAQTASLNGIGYDSNNNYIYGVNGSTIYQVGSDGNETAIGAPTNISSTGGDFLPGTNFLLTSSGGKFDLEDVTSTSPAATVKPASVILGTTTGSATFSANDVAVTLSGSNYVGYGLGMSTSTTATLYKVVIPVSLITANNNSNAWIALPAETITNAATVTSVTGITFPAAETPTTGESFGAAYTDSSGDAFFYANNFKALYEATATQVGTGSPFAVAYEASGTGLGSGSNDGADCPSASSPFSPPTPVSDSYTVVADNTLTVNSSLGASLLSNDQIISGATVTMGATTLEPGGVGQTATTFSSANNSGTLSGANGTLDVTDASNGYFTFTPNPGFTGPETFTYNLVETAPYNLTSTTAATVTINVVQQQVVTWSTPTALSASQSSTTPNAATDLGGAPLSYSVITASINTAGCSVNATSGAITYVGAGQCTIQAAAAATGSYSAASTQVTFTVSALVIPSLSWNPSPITLDTAQSGTVINGAPVTNSDGSVSYAIAGTGDTAGCSLNSSSIPVVLNFTATSAAQCSITVSTAATATYAANSVTVPFSIQAIPTFTWTPSPTTFSSAQSPGTLAPATTDSDGAVTYSVSSISNSANCSLASPSAPVVVSFTSSGTCTVTASLAASTSYTSATSISQPLTVTSPSIAQSVLFTSPVPVAPVVGDTYTPVAVGGASGNPVVFSIDSGSTSGCTYNAGNGVVTFAGPAGSCVIDANQAGNSSYDAAAQVHQTVTVSVAIEKIAQAVAFNGLTPSMPRVDSTYAPVANGGASGNPVVFSIDPGSTSGCTYNPDSGLVTFSAPAGSCIIDANQAGNTSYDAAAQVHQTVAVSGATQTVAFTSTAPGAPVVGSSYAPAAAGGESDNPIEFSIDPGSTSGCTYNPDTGLVTFSAPAGSCIIDADQVGNARYLAAHQVQQTITVPAGIAVPTGGTVAATPQGQGYWSIDGTGTLSEHGNAADYGSENGMLLGGPIVAVISTTTGLGYWLAAADGGVFAFGDAQFYGSLGALRLNQPIVEMARTPDNRGYWLVAADGGVFAFGDAQFYGSMGAVRLNKPITAITPTPDGRGYWLAAADGGVFSFGDARFYGSMGAVDLNKGVNGIVATPDGHGYWLIALDGGVFTFGDARFYGSLGNTGTTPITGIILSLQTNGYRLITPVGIAVPFAATP